MPLKIQHVFAAIERERARQDKDCNTPFTIEEEYRFLGAIIGRRGSDTRDDLVSLAAVAVRCLENNGLPSPEGEAS